MAKVLFTAVVADMRNKLNGSVFSKNRYGAYVRTKVTPVNPQTPAQANVRNRLATNSQAWRGLTEGQRNSWIAAAANFPVTDIFGNPKILSGNALYVKMNNNLLNIGITPIPSAPLPIAMPAITSLVLTAATTAGVVSLAYVISPTPTNFHLVIEATPQIPPGQMFVKNKYRFLASIAATDESPYDGAVAYAAQFGAPEEGNKIFVRAKLVSDITGQAGIPASSMAIIAS